MNAPPLRRNPNRALWGTMFLAFAVYAAVTFYSAAHAGLPDLVRFYVRMLFSLLWITVGVRGARGPRDIMGAIWALVWLAVFSVALWQGWYIDDSPAAN